MIEIRWNTRFFTRSEGYQISYLPGVVGAVMAAPGWIDPRVLAVLRAKAG